MNQARHVVIDSNPVNREIAAVLGVSANTVNVHRANLMQTLNLHNTAELVVYAIRNGLASIA